MLDITRRIKIDDPISWDHHRGGWRAAMAALSNTLHDARGIRFISAVEDELHFNGPIGEPWVGFIHQVPEQSLRFPDLHRLLRLDAWRESVLHCRGLWVLTEYQRRFLRRNGVRVPISKVQYPVDTEVPSFDPTAWLQGDERQLLHVGEFLRDYQHYFDLPAAGWRKLLLGSIEIRQHMEKTGVAMNDSVHIVDHISDSEYDQLLSRSVVFLHLKDAVGVTTVMECIARGTPMLINKVGAIPEFLGIDYPLYYKDLAEAEYFLGNNERILAAHRHLLGLPVRSKLGFESFISAVDQSAVYLGLPNPDVADEAMEVFDLSIIICSYKRVYNLKALLNALIEQDLSVSVEIIIWNNSVAARDLVEAECSDACLRGRVRIIHSSLNYRCAVRFALASLVQSPLIMVCDDDVLPTRDYLGHFLAKYNWYRERIGPDIAICCRGHIFRDHLFSEDHPGRVWDEEKELTFLNETMPDSEVHFMHADNCLIPTRLLKLAASHEMPSLETRLVDDYWLSYVLQEKLGARIVKIQADHVLSFTQCADDPNVAMFHDPKVKAARNSFYVYHSQHGWP